MCPSVAIKRNKYNCRYSCLHKDWSTFHNYFENFWPWTSQIRSKSSIHGLKGISFYLCKFKPKFLVLKSKYTFIKAYIGFIDHNCSTSYGMLSFRSSSCDNVAFFETGKLEINILDSRSNFLIRILQALYSF